MQTGEGGGERERAREKERAVSVLLPHSLYPPHSLTPLQHKRGLVRLFFVLNENSLEWMRTDEYSDLLLRQATEMMNTQTTMAEAQFRRSKTLRWSGGHDFISMYQVIHVNTEAFLARLPGLVAMAVHKGVCMATRQKGLKQKRKRGSGESAGGRRAGGGTFLGVLWTTG